MSLPLKRLLRIRALEQEIKRTALESESRRLRMIEEAADAARQVSARSRRAFVACLEEPIAEHAIGEAAWEIAKNREERLEAIRQHQARRFEAAKQAYLDCSREELKVKTLLHAWDTTRRLEEERRVQRELDDWFNLVRRRDS